MAHFAEINEDNIVQRVIVIADEDTADEEGNEVEAIGAQFCADLFGGTWVQTSYNSNFRFHFAGEGMKYDSELDAFYRPSHFPSWTLDEETACWKAPVDYPVPESEDDTRHYYWDEENQQWVDKAVV
tara:strand:+ start:603 stop:983 length:381 start_codon:yes stop_codon:yes gene_type:complete